MPRNLIIISLFFLSILIVRPSQVLAENLLSEVSSTQLRFSLVETESAFKILVRPIHGLDSLKSDLTANVFAIESPSRLVIDIPNIRSRKGKDISIKHPLFSGLRLGVHQNKTRIVLDILGNRIPEYSISSDIALGALVVDLSFPGEQMPSTPDSYTEISEPDTTMPSTSPEVPVPLVETKPKVSEPEEMVKTTFDKEPPKQPTAFTSPVIEKSEPAPPPKPKDTYIMKDNQVVEAPLGTTASLTTATPEEKNTEPKSSFSSSLATVNGIYYQTTKNNTMSSLRIDVDGLNKYALSHKDKNKYELLLENAQLAGNHLTLPQFPPDTFAGFEVVVAHPQGDNVIIKVYVEESVKISPYIAQGKLWLRASALAKN